MPSLNIRAFLFCVGAIRALPHIAIVSMSTARPEIYADVTQWMLHYKNLPGAEKRGTMALIWLIWRFPEFRNLFGFRIEHSNEIVPRAILKLADLLYPRHRTLYILNNHIGPGLFIQHGFSTIIAAKKIGSNCWINQQVTIGYADHDESCPTIGNNVRIAAGAKVFGRIHIGDNSIIGANAVVCKSVPSNCTVAGVPAYIIRRNGVRMRTPLTGAIASESD